MCDAVETVMRQKCDKIQSLQVSNYAGCDDATQLRVILTLTCVASAKVSPARSVLCSFPKEPKGYARIPLALLPRREAEPRVVVLIVGRASSERVDTLEVRHERAKKRKNYLNSSKSSFLISTTLAGKSDGTIVSSFLFVSLISL